MTETYDALAAPFDDVFEDSRGGFSFHYVTGEQVTTRLNEVLGVAGWSFEIKEHGYNPEADEMWVLAVIKARIDESVVERQQFGSQKVHRSRQAGNPLDVGFDLKGAATDAMKKTASLLGVGLYLSKRSPEEMATQRAERAESAPRPRATTAQNGSIMCDCGTERVYKEGTNKAGKDWSGWMCASNPGKCPPVWGTSDLFISSIPLPGVTEDLSTIPF